MNKRKDEGKLLTGNEIFKDYGITDKYVFSIQYLHETTGDYITDEEYMYESDHNEIMTTLTNLLEIIDLKIGEAILSDNYYLTLKEKEWAYGRSKGPQFIRTRGSTAKQIHLNLVFQSE